MSMIVCKACSTPVDTDINPDAAEGDLCAKCRGDDLIFPSTNACGTCRMCCSLLGVEELQKPMNVMCRHATNSGCGIYAERPGSCAKYECLWLQTQTSAYPLPENVRPDRIRVIFDLTTKRDDSVVARTKPGEHWRIDTPAVQRVIATILKLQKFVVVVSGKHREVLTKDPAELRETFSDGEIENIKARLVVT